MNGGAKLELRFPVFFALYRLHGGDYFREMPANLHPIYLPAFYDKEITDSFY
jgi:hypothetical protein